MYTTMTWVQLSLWVLQNTMRTSTMKGFGCLLPHLLPISCSTMVLEALPTPVQCPGSGTHGVGSWEDSCCCVRKANGGQAMTSEQKTMGHGELKLVLTCSPCGCCFLLRRGFTRCLPRAVQSLGPMAEGQLCTAQSSSIPPESQLVRNSNLLPVGLASRPPAPLEAR